MPPTTIPKRAPRAGSRVSPALRRLWREWKFINAKLEEAELEGRIKICRLWSQRSVTGCPFRNATWKEAEAQLKRIRKRLERMMKQAGLT